MFVEIANLRRLTTEALVRRGYDRHEAVAICDVLIYAQLRGNDQGLVKLVDGGYRKRVDAGPISVCTESPLSALIDGKNNAGILVMRRATETAAQLARQAGFGIVGTCNTDSSTGAVGYYARSLALEGFIGFAFAGSRPLVAPVGSSEPLFGTNPIAVAFPSDGEPFVIDLATSAITYFSLLAASKTGQRIPIGIAIDPNGKPTTDPARAMAGSVRGFDGGYKSYALAMLVEVLTGPLVNAGHAGLDATSGWGNLVFAIAPSLLVPEASFRSKVSRLLQHVRRARPLDDSAPVSVPGDRGDAVSARNVASGVIEVDDLILAELDSETAP